jgi:hypothetical protein
MFQLAETQRSDEQITDQRRQNGNMIQGCLSFQNSMTERKYELGRGKAERHQQ